jgi:NAD(P)H-hydrate epimerase
MSSAQFPQVRAEQLAWITTADMIEVDRIMIDELHIGLIQMMENAGRNLARLVLDLMRPSSAAVGAGSGGNGGGGMVAARHLANAGVDVTLTTTRPADRLGEVTAHQLDVLERMGIKRSDRLAEADVVVDAVIGYSLAGAPRGAEADLIRQIVSNGRPVVSLDVPSGLDATTGGAPGDVASADATMTLALPKSGLRNAPQAGALYLADISVPPSVTAAFERATPDFSESPILRVV